MQELSLNILDIAQNSVVAGASLIEITIEAYNQNGELVLTNVTEAIVKCRPQTA